MGKWKLEVEPGFTAGLSARYDYANTPWISEFGWEYRSNDAVTITSDGTTLPGGNYASNIFYLNGRYSFYQQNKFNPWLGGGVTWVQEIDLDSEDESGERSFSASGDTGVQLLLGFDYNVNDKLYLTGELRNSIMTGINLTEEGASSADTVLVSDIDYSTTTLGIGLGYRF